MKLKYVITLIVAILLLLFFIKSFDVILYETEKQVHLNMIDKSERDEEIVSTEAIQLEVLEKKREINKINFKPFYIYKLQLSNGMEIRVSEDEFDNYEIGEIYTFYLVEKLESTISTFIKTTAPQ